MSVNTGIYKFWVLLFCAFILFTFSIGFTQHEAKQLLVAMDLQRERKIRET